jgi:type VI protein secretion system component VasK
MYQQALERLMRPRLILSLEQQIQKNIDDPSFVYEALKVYLMLGGKAPSADKDLILSWVHPRLGGARLSRRPLRARPGAATGPPRGDARYGFGRRKQGLP